MMSALCVLIEGDSVRRLGEERGSKKKNPMSAMVEETSEDTTGHRQNPKMSEDEK